MICNRRDGHEADETTKDKPNGNRCPEDDFLPLLARLWNLGPWLLVLSALESCALKLSLSRYMYSCSYVRVGMQSATKKVYQILRGSMNMVFAHLVMQYD